MLNRILLLMLTGIALALAACGDDDEDSGPTKSEFIEKADTICADTEKQTEEIVRAGLSNPENPRPQEVLDIIQELIPLQRDALDQIRELEKPEGDENEINDFLDKAETATDETEQIDDPQQAVATIEAANTPDDPYYEANRAAEEYGLQTCAE